jgi:hypothetical protein
MPWIIKCVTEPRAHHVMVPIPLPHAATRATYGPSGSARLGFGHQLYFQLGLTSPCHPPPVRLHRLFTKSIPLPTVHLFNSPSAETTRLEWTIMGLMPSLPLGPLQPSRSSRSYRKRPLGAASENAGVHEAFRVRIRVATQVRMAFPGEAGSRPCDCEPRTASCLLSADRTAHSGYLVGWGVTPSPF